MADYLKRERKLRRHYVDASPTPNLSITAEMDLVRIGRDNDTLSRTIVYNTEETQNVWGETETATTRGGDTMDVNPYYIRKGEPLGELLEAIDWGNKQLDDIKRWYVEAIFDEATPGVTSVPAMAQLADIRPTEAGGAAANADMVAFTLAMSGEKIKGMLSLADLKFTPEV